MTDVPFDSLESFIAEYYRHNPDGHYFDPEMLKYFGEDKALMRVINRAMTLATDMFGNGLTAKGQQIAGTGFAKPFSHDFGIEFILEQSLDFASAVA